MTDFPDKVYVDKRSYAAAPFERRNGGQEYIRADLVPTWQPMDTAPKDGAAILCMNKEGYVRRVFWPYDSLRYFDAIKWMPIPK